MQLAVQGRQRLGEGAGYAGGITSAAVDGLRVAEAIVTERLSETAAPVICEGIASAQPVSGETAFCEKEGR